MNTSALTIAGSSIPPFYVLAVLATTGACIEWLRGIRVRHPALPVLGAFLVVATLLTFIGPALFQGVFVLDPRSGIDGQIVDPTPLDYTAPMFAQLVYLVLACGVVLYLGQREALSPTILTPAFLIGGTLSAVRLIPGAAPIIDSQFRNYASAAYNPYEQRHFGIFAEPSFLAVFSISALTYAVYRYRLARGPERATVVAIGALAALNLLMSNSGTAAASAIFILIAGLLYYGGRFLFAGMRVHPGWLVACFGASIFLLVPNGATAALWSTIEDKSESGSFLARSASDIFSVSLTIQTWGLGVGLGANRPSSFFALVLSSVGIAGTILLAAFLVRTLLPTRHFPDWAPVAMSVVALIIAKVVAESSLTTPVMWLALGALVYATRSNPRGQVLSAASPRKADVGSGS